MVSKASDDLPEPESPVKTTSLSRGMESVMFLRLCSRAPRIVIWSVGIGTFGYPLFSLDRKRAAGRRHQAPAWAFHPALRNGGPPPGVDHVAHREKLLADLRRRDEVQLEVEAHRARDAWHQRAKAAAHGRVGQCCDHATVDETAVIGHVLGRGHLDGGAALDSLDQVETEPAPGRRVNLGLTATHGPVLPAPACRSTRPARSGGLPRRTRPPR